MFPLRFAVGLLLLAPCLLLGACGCGERYMTEDQAGMVEAPLAPASHFQLHDVPVPAEISYSRANSFISETPRGRSASLVYNGRVHPERAANFFRDQLSAPAIGWKLKDSRMAGSRYVMIFTKGKAPEYCVVSIERRPFGMLRVTVDVH